MKQFQRTSIDFFFFSLKDQRETLRKKREAKEIAEKNAFMEGENALRKEFERATHSSQLKKQAT